MCIVALVLGMLLANMLKSVCGCKVVEGAGTIASTCLGSCRVNITGLQPGLATFAGGKIIRGSVLMHVRISVTLTPTTRTRDTHSRKRAGYVNMSKDSLRKPMS